jgi:FkbM family methyltransferase
MKSIREFIYLSKKANFFYALFYLFYKARLRVQNFHFFKKFKKNKESWIEKIYAYLEVQNNKTEIVNGKKLFYENYKGLKIYLRPCSSDILVYSQVIHQKSYQPVIEIYDQIFKTRPIRLIDLGANIGLTSIFFAKKYKEISITAFEPFKENVEMAELNMRTNNLKSYKIIEGGIWNKNTNLSLKRDFRDGKEWGINLVETLDGKIPGYGIQEILLNYEEPIDFLKIDIEGAEVKLFENIDYASGFLKKVKCIAMEIHDEFKCRNTIYHALKVNYFIYYDIGDMTIALNRNYF